MWTMAETSQNALDDLIAAECVHGVTGIHPSLWNVRIGPCSGLGTEYVYTLPDESRCVYVCVENGKVTACETN